LWGRSANGYVNPDDDVRCGFPTIKLPPQSARQHPSKERNGNVHEHHEKNIPVVPDETVEEFKDLL
jgi:hypothetical protein